MRAASVGGLVVSLLVAGAAMARPDTLRMSCAQARALVAGHGAIVLGTGPYRYERYVATRAFCPGQGFVQAAHVPTRDAAQCTVGLLCLNYKPWIAPGH